MGSHTLADGRRIRIRPLTADDLPAVRAAFEHADPADLRRRFMGGPPPTTWIVDAVQRADGIHDRFLGAFDMTGRLVGIAQFDRGGDERAAEIAVVVDHDWQRQGVGTFLLRRLAGDARRQGITEFTATFFADNMGIRRLLRDVGPVTAGTVSCGEGSARLDLLRVG